MIQFPNSLRGKMKEESELSFPIKVPLTIVGFIIVAVFLYAFWPFVSVPAGHRGVVTIFGDVRPGSLKPGLNLVNPMSHVLDLTVQVQKAEMNGDAASRDLQSVHTTMAVNFHLNPDLVDKLYTNIGLGYVDKILVSPGQDVFKAVTSHYTAEELISKREEVRQNILFDLRAKVSHLSDSTIVVDDVFVTNFNFSPEFNKAIESKQEAEQLALKAKRDLERIRVEAEQRVVTAKAEAERIKIQAEAIKAQGGAEYVQLQAIAKWNGQLPSYMTAGAALPMVGVGIK